MNRSAAREQAFKLLYSLEIQKENLQEQIELYFENEEISDAIKNEVKRGVTGLYGKGMYSNKEKLILICAVSRGDVHKIKDLARRIDKRSFIVVANAREVLGKGFKEE